MSVLHFLYLHLILTCRRTLSLKSPKNICMYTLLGFLSLHLFYFSLYMYTRHKIVKMKEGAYICFIQPCALKWSNPELLFIYSASLTFHQVLNLPLVKPISSTVYLSVFKNQQIEHKQDAKRYSSFVCPLRVAPRY